jgi:ER-bound oxygenase mpaB/B'/Rubber oxygenase, catalytic domain
MTSANGRSRWTDALLDEKRHKCDKPADDAVGEVFERGGVEAVNDVMQTLVRTDQPVPDALPQKLKDYLRDTLPLPDWADMGKIEHGQRLFEQWGVHISCCLFCASLPSSYAAAKGVRVLDMTARLDTDAHRRVLETGQFLVDVLNVGGLEDNGVGRRTIQKVRLMHAAVRHLIKVRNQQEPGLWDFAEFGEPINQEDLAGTMLAFSDVVGEPMSRLGVTLGPEDIDAYLHLWNVVSHLLGLDDDLLVRDADDAAALVAAIERRQFKSSPEGKRMTEALLELLDKITPGYLFDDTIPPLIRHLIGEKTANLIGVPHDLGVVSRVANWFFIHVLGRPGRRYARMSVLAQPFGRELLRGLLNWENRGGERASFAIPDHLVARWQIRT